ncbi:probable cytochrome P450 6a13 [Sitodiplosis mosellana]|uniref:probable cytochrome P450 6a13 n=1 Tax=Sitodiplosis mosellana TaxID=263140 RepID=UPI002443D14D|nr:probable cytochrome P450 6a13 [Sitodiplosis mosellana]
MIVFALLILVTTLVYVYVKWRYTYWSKLGVPYPEPVFFFGNVLEAFTMSSHISSLCEKWYNNYPTYPYTGYYKLLNPAINLRDPDLIKDVLIKDHFSFHDNEQHFNKRFDSLMMHNPFVASNDSWRKGRTVLTPLLTLLKVKSFHPSIVDSCEKLTNYLRTLPPNEDVEAKSLIARFATQNVMRCLFSLDTKCFTETKNEFLDLGTNIFKPTSWSGIKLMIMSICPMLRDIMPFGFVPAYVGEWFRCFVKELKEERLKSEQHQQDFLQMLLSSVDKYDINEAELAGYALAMFVDSYETSSGVLGFAIYELARNPDIQERLYEEITDVLAKYDGEFTFEALHEMKYLENVIYETMRLDVVDALISKICTKEYTLPLIEGQKEPVTIYPGTAIQISTRALHMDPKYYPDPETFDPNRFTEEERRERHKAVYLSFGEGPRMCIGIKFALAQTKAGLMSIVRDFKVTISPNQKPVVMDNRASIYHARHGLIVNFTPRTKTK